jgi:hypothetical protein
MRDHPALQETRAQAREDAWLAEMVQKAGPLARDLLIHGLNDRGGDLTSCIVELTGGQTVDCPDDQYPIDLHVFRVCCRLVPGFALDDGQAIAALAE